MHLDEKNSKEEIKKKFGIKEEEQERVKNGPRSDQPEIKKGSNCGKIDDRCCPFMKSRDDVPKRLLLVSDEAYGQRLRSNRWSSDHGSASWSPLLNGLEPPMTPRVPHSLSPWNDLNCRMLRQCYSTGASLPGTSRQQVSSEGVSPRQNQLSTTRRSRTGDRNRWDDPWKDRQFPDIAYSFKYYSDIRRYMEQYRLEHTYKRDTRKRRKEEYYYASLPTIPSLFSFPPPLERSSKEATTQRVLRISYHHQSLKLKLPCTTNRRAEMPRKTQTQQLRSVLEDALREEEDKEGGESQGLSSGNTTTYCQESKTRTGISLARCVLPLELAQGSDLQPESLVLRKNATPNFKDEHLQVTTTTIARNRSSSQNLNFDMTDHSRTPSDAECLSANISNPFTPVLDPLGKSSSSAKPPAKYSSAMATAPAADTDHPVHQCTRFPTTTFIAITDLSFNPSTVFTSAAKDTAGLLRRNANRTKEAQVQRLVQTKQSSVVNRLLVSRSRTQAM